MEWTSGILLILLIVLGSSSSNYLLHFPPVRGAWISSLLSNIISISIPSYALTSDKTNLSLNNNDGNHDLKQGKESDYCPIPSRKEGQAIDRRSNKNQLVIVEFNVEWLFLYGGKGNIKCPSPKCPWKSVQDAENHINEVVRVIEHLNPDIIHLNEVENCQILRKIIDKMKDNSNFRGYMISSTDTATGQNVGLITKIDPIASLARSTQRESYPIEDSSCHYKGKGGDTSVSKHYLAHFNISLSKSEPQNTKYPQFSFKRDYLEFLFIGAHLLAFPSKRDRCAQREAQAVVLKDLIQSNLEKSKNPDMSIIIVGDLNDYDLSLTNPCPDPIHSQVLDILAKSTKPRLINVGHKAENNTRYSHWYDRNHNCFDDGGLEHSLIDHILLSSELFHRIKQVEYYHGFNMSCGNRVSDHWPIKVVIDTSI